jgi:hypothetical protein
MVWSVADFGGVGGPVARGQALPGDGDVCVDAQGAGENGGGDLGGELEQCCAACPAGTDPEVTRQPGWGRPRRSAMWTGGHGLDRRVAERGEGLALTIAPKLHSHDGDIRKRKNGRRHSADLGWCGEGEKPREQLRDALRFVVMHPMRRVRQALDVVEVGHVIVVGFGELRA